MPMICYVEKRFAKTSLEIIDHANEFIEDYLAQGLTLTLRQLYYRFVAGDLLRNKLSEYKRLGSIINDARLAGLIDWNAIEDRTRNIIAPSHWNDQADIIKTAANSYALDKWEGQEKHVEVWVEKEALIGIIERACEELDVSCFACRGYPSQSELWAAARRFRRINEDDRQPVIIHLGDHDPSGIDMTRDLRDRMIMFGADVEVNRIALTMDQVEEYDPPPNPAKQTDSRCTGYVEEYGDESWELDALDPPVLHELIQNTIKENLDQELFDDRVELQEEQRKTLEEAANRWEEIAGFLGNEKGRRR